MMKQKRARTRYLKELAKKTINIEAKTNLQL